MDFRIKDGEVVRTRIATKASGTVIEAGDMVGIDGSGLIIKATAGSTKLGYAPNGAGNGETEIEVTVGNDFTLVGTGDANFTAAIKGTEVDLVLSGSDQRIDVGTSTTDVFTVSIDKDAGTLSSALNIEVRINKPLF